MIFIYGRTPFPKKTTDIYVPSEEPVNPVFCGERGKMNTALLHFGITRRDANVGRRGHRCGVKGKTLADLRT